MHQQHMDQIQSKYLKQRETKAKLSDAHLSQLVRQAQLQEEEAYSDNFWGKSA